MPGFLPYGLLPQSLKSPAPQRDFLQSLKVSLFSVRWAAGIFLF